MCISSNNHLQITCGIQTVNQCEVARNDVLQKVQKHTNVSTIRLHMHSTWTMSSKYMRLMNVNSIKTFVKQQEPTMTCAKK